MSKHEPGQPEKHDDIVMECSECVELMDLIAEYLDDSETVEMRQALAAHAASCDHCARLLWSMRRVVGTCRAESSPAVPGEVHIRLWQVLVQEFRVEGRPQPDDPDGSEA